MAHPRDPDTTHSEAVRARGPRKSKPPRVVVEYDTSPEAEARYVAAIRLLVNWTVDRFEQHSAAPYPVDAPSPAAGHDALAEDTASA
jgi:hypothetical protein